MITLNTNPGLLRTAVYERILSDLQQGAIAPARPSASTSWPRPSISARRRCATPCWNFRRKASLPLYPQRGVMVNALSEEEKREIYEVCGVLDGQVIRNVFPA